MNLGNYGTLNQLFIRGSCTHIKFSKNDVDSGKSPFFVTDLFCTPHLICLNIGFGQRRFLWKCCAFIRSTLN